MKILKIVMLLAILCYSFSFSSVVLAQSELGKTSGVTGISNESVGDKPDESTDSEENLPIQSSQETSLQSTIDISPEAAAYNLKLRNIEERVNALKEKSFRCKARLIQLQEVVLHGTISGAKAVLVHKNNMCGSFRLWRAQYSLDGTPIFNRVDLDTGELN